MPAESQWHKAAEAVSFTFSAGATPQAEKPRREASAFISFEERGVFANST